MTKLRDSRETSEQRFDRLYEETSDAVLAYLVRRSHTPEDAADALAETHTAAWRKLDSLPEGDQARLWLFGAAPNELHRTSRTLRADDDLGATLANDLPPLWEQGPDVDDDNGEILDALATLSRLDQEIITLTAWEELTPREIATVLGLSANVARIRLHRARTKLRALLKSDQAVNLSQRPASRRLDNAPVQLVPRLRVARAPALDVTAAEERWTAAVITHN